MAPIINGTIFSLKLRIRSSCPSCPHVTEPGDVEMCVHCYQWWICDGAITAQTAGELARGEMDPYECIAALDRAARMMDPLPERYDP